MLTTIPVLPCLGHRCRTFVTGDYRQTMASGELSAICILVHYATSLRSKPTNAHLPASILAGTSLTPRVPVAFALTRSARAITGDRKSFSARARLPSRGIITSFSVSISSFHFGGWGGRTAHPREARQYLLRLTPSFRQPGANAPGHSPGWTVPPATPVARAVRFAPGSGQKRLDPAQSRRHTLP